jgi:hypothetical protein
MLRDNVYVVHCKHIHQILKIEDLQIFSEYARYQKHPSAPQGNALYAKPIRHPHITESYGLDDVTVKVKRLVVELLGADISQEQVE